MPAEKRSFSHPSRSAQPPTDSPPGLGRHPHTELRRQVILSKPFLQRIYDDWYRLICEHAPADGASVLELGSGAGSLANWMPSLITSEVFFCCDVKLVANALALPFSRDSLRAIVMTDVLHHISDVRQFFQESAICLRPGGAIVMIEPWVSWWSRIIYGKFHHEPFQPESREWSFPALGPLSGANGALPWILFERDQEVFAKEFPQFSIELVRPMMPFRYLVSGGISMRNLMPGFTYGMWSRLERLLQPWMRHWAMFALIVLRRT